MLNGTITNYTEVTNDEIFFFKEGKYKIGNKFVYGTRAFVLKKEKNIKPLLKPTYEV
jgi:hypothetical protein